MEAVNYNHLFYFWMVAREGSLVAAGRKLRLSHPTLSTQIRALEDSVGAELFNRDRRRMVLSPAGEIAFRYADEMFSLGRELVDAVRGAGGGHTARLHVGIADVIPKLVVRRLLEPALRLEERVRVVCYEDSHDKLLAELALHSLHVVISDTPIASGSPIKAFHHSLGETGITFFAAPRLAKKYRPGFPSSLHNAPMLLPLEHLTLRRALNGWFDRQNVVPDVVAEFEDSALFKVFGAEGIGVFPSPTAIEDEVVKQYGVKIVGRAEGIKERFYAITLARKVSHPAVKAISESARENVFS